MRKKLKSMKSKNTKEFWNLLKTKRKNVKPEVPIDIFYDFFKSLNSETENENIDLTLPENQGLNEYINGEITKEEILNCVKQLKNNKASGDDHIFNEYIKNTWHMLMPVYIQLFNITFDTGIIPEA